MKQHNRRWRRRQAYARKRVSRFIRDLCGIMEIRYTVFVPPTEPILFGLANAEPEPGLTREGK